MIFLQNLTIFSIFWLSNLLFLTYNLIFLTYTKSSTFFLLLYKCNSKSSVGYIKYIHPATFERSHYEKTYFICKQKLVQRCCVCCSFCCNSIMFTLVLPGRIRRASNEFKSLPRLKHDWSFSELFPILRIGRWFQWQNN